MAEGDGIIVGSVGVDVVPIAERFWSEFRAKTGPEASRVGQDIGRQIGAPIAERVAKGIGDGVDAGAKTVGGKGTKAGEDFGGAFARTVKTRVEAAIKSLPKVELHAESTDAEVKIAAIRAELEALSSQRIGIDVDEGIALAQLDRLHEELTRLGAESPTASVRVDAAKAAAELAAVQAEIDKVAESRPTVTVDADTGAAEAKLAAVDSEAVSAGGGVRGLIVAGLALAPALVPAAAAAAAGIAGIGLAATVGIAGVGALVLAGTGVVETVKAMTQEQAGAGQAAAAHAAAQLRVAGAVDQVRSAEASLANARAAAADAQTRAAEQVRAAEQNLTSAQQQARLAQLDLTRAREAARQALEDLAAQTVDAGLAQRQANLDQIRAKADLDKVLADPHATAVQRQQAQLTYDQAVQQAREATVRQQRLTQQKKEADAAGINGSQQVLTAQNAITAAQQRAADAQTHLADARRAQDTQARQSAYAIAQAQQQLVNAQRAYTRATVEAGAAGGAAMAKLHAQIAAQPAAVREFATFLLGLKPLFKDLQASTAAGLLPGIESGLQRMQPLFEPFKLFLGDLAHTLGDLFTQASRALTAPFWRGFFDYLDNTAGPVITQIGHVVGNFTTGLAGLLEAFNPVARAVGDGIEGLSRRFADWATNLRNNPQFQAFLAYTERVGPKVADAIGALGRALGRLAVALAPIGEGMVDGIRGLADAIARAPVNTVRDLTVGVIGLVVALKTVPPAITAIKTALKLDPVALAVTAVALAVGGLAIAFEHGWSTSARFRTEVTDGLQTLKTTFGDMGRTAGAMLADLGIKVDDLGTAFEHFAVMTQFNWDTFVKPILTGNWSKFGDGTAFGLDRIKMAEEDLAGAQANTRRAQDDLNASRREAVQRLDDLAGRMSQLSLDERGAQLAIARSNLELKKAQADAARVAADPNATAEQRQEAQLALREAQLGHDQAVQREKDVRGEQAKTRADAAKARVEAVRGSDEARKKLADAHDAQVKAERDLGSTRRVAAQQFIGERHSMWGNIKRDAAGAWDSVKRTASNAWSSVTDAASSAGRRISSAFTGIAAAAVTFAAKGVLTWRKVKDEVGKAWDSVKDKVTGLVTHDIPAAFRTGVDAILGFWQGLQDKAKQPVVFFIDTVINKGIIDSFNHLLDKLHLPSSLHVGHVSSTFATGGITPGWSPGRDIHHFYSPTAGWLSLAGGEPIMRPEFGAAVGHGWIHAANAAARAGGVAGVRRFLGGYADGGVLPVLPSFGYDTGAYRPAGLSIGSAAAAPALTVDQLAAVRGDGGAAGGMTLRLVVDDGAVAGLVRVQVDEAYGALANALVYDTH